MAARRGSAGSVAGGTLAPSIRVLVSRCLRRLSGISRASPREVRRLLDPTGTLYFHIDYREAHYVKSSSTTLCSRLFPQRDRLGYDTGRARAAVWPANTTRSSSTSRPGALLVRRRERRARAYMAPGLVTPEKAARGKLPTDFWWHTIVSPTDARRRVINPKPEGSLRRIVDASSRPGDWCLTRSPAAGHSEAVARKLAAASS